MAALVDLIPTLSRRTATIGMLVTAAGAALATCGAASPLYENTFAKGGPWLNELSFGSSDLQGKVVLVNFWTYTCINSLRPLPFLRAWWDKYRGSGLVMIGVHAPEFSFEHELPRVREAVAEHQIHYPVVVDNDFRIWRAFDNNAWPAFYLLDAVGRLRHRHLGEGEYEQTERLIQQLLAEAGRSDIIAPTVAIAGQGIEAAPDWQSIGTPETYVGYTKAENSVSGGQLRRDRPADYRRPDALPPNGWGLSGGWKVEAEFAEGFDNATILFRFRARDLHLVMGLGTRASARFRVRIDGGAPGADHGTDVDEQGNGIVRAARLYQLVRQTGPVRDRVFEIEFLDPGPRVYCFTFG